MIADRRGSALTLVLVFGVLAFSAAALYLTGQTSLAKLALRKPSHLQARLNARSAVYWGLDYLRDSSRVDTLRTVNTLDTLFSMNLFEDDSSSEPLSTSLLPLDGTPYSIPFFDTLSIGQAEIARELAGASVVLRGRGMTGGVWKTVTAELGSRWRYGPDTLLYLPRNYAVTNFRWAVGHADPAAVRMGELDEYLEMYAGELVDTSVIPAVIEQPAIMDNAALERIPDEVQGSVLIDGSFTELRWHDDRRVVIHGDLQLTGSVSLRGLRLLVEKEIRLLDQCRLEDVDLVAGTRIYMAGTCSFSGSALSVERVVIRETAEVANRSIVVAAGGGKPAAGHKAPPASRTGKSADSLTYTLAVLDEARVDGALVSLGEKGSIRIDPGVHVKGIVYAEGKLCMNGLLTGVAKARELVDCRDARKPVPNVVGGEIKMAPDLSEYRLPSFMGRQVVVQWSEEMEETEPEEDEFPF